jgi:hypothetical protein
MTRFEHQSLSHTSKTQRIDQLITGSQGWNIRAFLFDACSFVKKSTVMIPTEIGEITNITIDINSKKLIEYFSPIENKYENIIAYIVPPKKPTIFSPC